jgi:hypothetical protein
MSTTRFKDAVDIKVHRLGEIIEATVDAFGLEDTICILEDNARERGYVEVADWLRTARQVIEVENEEAGV